jgi:hypothetical protein
MRALVVLLVILGVIGAAGYFTRPGQGWHRGVASKLMEEGKVPRPDTATGKYAFSDFLVVTRSTMTSGDAKLLECWGVFTRFYCTGAPQADAPTNPA